MQPFANALVTLDLTGAQIDQVLEQQFDNPAVGQQRFLQVSDGFSYSWSASAPVGSKVSGITIGGIAVDPTATYRATMNIFLAGVVTTSRHWRGAPTASRVRSTSTRWSPISGPTRPSPLDRRIATPSFRNPLDAAREAGQPAPASPAVTPAARSWRGSARASRRRSV